jgi:hypothetical protein
MAYRDSSGKDIITTQPLIFSTTDRGNERIRV